MKTKYLSTLLLFFSIVSFSQTSLDVGDVAITSFNSDSNDEFSFILLKEVAPNTVIYFTENGWDDDADGGGIAETWGNTNEGTLQWTSSSTTMPAGTQVQVILPKSNATLSVSEGSITKFGTWSLSSTSDSIIIYQGTDKPTDGSEVTKFIWAFNTGTNDWTSNASSTAATGIPLKLTDGTNAVSFTSTTTADNFQYNCTVTSVSSISTLRSSLVTPGDFTSGSSNNDYQAPACFSTTWNGATDTSWADSTNWSDGIPVYGYNATIANVTNKPIIGSSTEVNLNNLTINTSATLTLSSGAALTINGDFSSADDNALTAESASSIILKGTTSGKITYNRNLPSTDWYLISSPVSGVTAYAFLSSHSLELGSGSGDAQNQAFAYYDNTETLTTERWSYYTVDASNDGGTGDDTTDNMENGQGFITKFTAAADASFSGDLNTSNVLRGITSNSNAFNAIGNPYTAYVNSGTFLTDNTSLLTSQTLWVWNGSNYEAKVTIDGFKLAPGQGFFVECGTAGDVTFSEASLSHETTDTFQRVPSTDKAEIQLYMSDGTSNKYAKIYYLDGATTGFDNGYDGELFGGVSNPFAVYSHLVSDSEGKDYQIQSLPNSNYEDMVIPVGVNATAGKEITFTINTQNLPTDYKVYIEDKNDGTHTRLDKTDSNYKITLSSDLNGIGRFYLHTRTSVLSTNDETLVNNVSIYPTSKNNLRITGLKEGTNQLSIYNILGKQVFKSNFVSKPVNDINIPNVKTGVYIIQLKTAYGNVNKKVVLR